MFSRSVLAFVGLAAAGLFGGVPTIQAQQNDALLKRGEMLWMNRGCGGCHGIGKKNAGPDLAGLEARRSKEWIVKFLKNTNQMLMTDSVAVALVREWGGVRMPEQPLTDQDIEALLAYRRAQEQKLRE